MSLNCLGMLVAVAVGSAPAHATDDLSSGLLGCASLGVDSERLTCYDRLAARLGTHKDHPQAAVAAPPAKEVFGLKAAPERPVAKTVEHSELNSVSARVTSLRARSQGGVTVELDNGQSWEELGNTDLELEVGDTVTIARGALGSFRLTTPHKRIAKVTRVR
jgi:hypothetical protein